MGLWFVNPEKTVEIPVGGEQFTPAGFIGPLMAAMLYRFDTWVDLKGADVPQPKYSWKDGNDKYHYYYNNSVDVAVAYAAANDGYAPQPYWVFQMKTTEVMNSTDPSRLEKWGDKITLETAIYTYQSKKHRHEFHLMALPAAVAAAAKAMGYVDELFSFAELLDQNAVFNDEFHFKMIGHPDHKVEEIFTETVLGQRRAELWRQLGEENPMAYTVKGDKHVAGNNKLRECLSIVHNEWTVPAYARLVSIPDPRADAIHSKKTDENGNPLRLLVPVIMELFENKADAQKAADADKERFAKKDGATTANGKPALPAEWREAGEDMWMEAIEPLRGKPAPVVKKAIAADNLSATYEEVKAWLDYTAK